MLSGLLACLSTARVCLLLAVLARVIYWLSRQPNQRFCVSGPYWPRLTQREKIALMTPTAMDRQVWASGRVIDFPRVEAGLAPKHRRPVVVMPAVKESFVRLTGSLDAQADGPKQ